MEDAIRCEVNDQAIQPQKIFEFARDLGHGAQAFFFGSVRAENRGREVIAVAYDAAPILAQKVIHEIAAECVEKWGSDLRIAVYHRTGKLGVGELSVGIGVTSRHRDESFQACRYIIEQIKVRVPIWKKEFYADGETDWLKGHALCQHAH